jgi:hypothetical protein
MGRRKRANGAQDEATRYRERVQEVFSGSIRALHRAVQSTAGLTSFETVRKIVQGERQPSDAQRTTLANALGVEPVWLAVGMTPAAFAEQHRSTLLAQHQETRERGLAIDYDPADVRATVDLPEPRRSAVLRFGRLLDVAPLRSVSRGSRREELVPSFLHPGDRTPVLLAAAEYLAAAEAVVTNARAIGDGGGRTDVPQGFSYVVWSDLVLRTFALTLRN